LEGFSFIVPKAFWIGNAKGVLLVIFLERVYFFHGFRFAGISNIEIEGWAMERG
jgi:hypothetical protein